MRSLLNPTGLPIEKVKRILVYPNITSRNYEQDSYVDALAMMIKSLNDVRNDLFWYIISPIKLKALDFPNTYQFEIGSPPTYSPQMRLNFDSDKLKHNVMNYRNYQYDLVFSHLPEHTHQLMSTLKYQTHFDIKCLGYCHWFDFPSIVTWKHTFLQNICGLLEMDLCFVNTNAQKDLVIETAEKYFSKEVIKRLDDILTSNLLGIKESDCVDSIRTDYEKIIVFNHRPWEYKDYDTFLKTCDMLWEQRQDFRVWVPLEKVAKRPYMYCDKFDKKGYYNQLSKCCVCYAPKQKYAGWNISATDAMMNGCPVVFYDGEYYKEMYMGDTFRNPQEAVVLLSKYLDNSEYRNSEAQLQLNHSKTKLPYSRRSVFQLYDAIDTIITSTGCVQAQGKLSQIKEIIKSHGSISKSELLKELKWGQGINFTKYRMALMQDPNIFDFQNTEECYFVWQ